MEFVLSKTARLLGIALALAALGSSVALTAESEEEVFAPSSDLPEG